MIKKYFYFFVSGALSTLLFHQGLLGLFYLAQVLPRMPYDMTPTEPLGVPSVLSLSFFGGLWGIVISILSMKSRANSSNRVSSSHEAASQLKTFSNYWAKMIIFGAIGPSLVALLVVFPLKGIPFRPEIIPVALLLNGFWGLGVGLLNRWFFSKADST